MAQIFILLNAAVCLGLSLTALHLEFLCETNWIILFLCYAGFKPNVRLLF